MAFPSDSIGNQWTDLEALDAAAMHTRVDIPLDALRAAQPPVALIMLGRNDGFSIADNTPTAVTFYGEGQLAQTDPTGILTLPGSGKIQTGRAGVYEWSSTVAWDAMGGSGTQHRRVLYVWKNGVQPSHSNGRDDKPVPSGTWPAMYHTSTGRISMNDGDYLQAVLYQDSGGAIAFTSLIFSLSLVVTS